MTKQELLRIGVEAFIKQELFYLRHGSEDKFTKNVAEVILRYEMSQGVVIKTDKSLPNEILCEDGSMAWIEPLIEG